MTNGRSAAEPILAIRNLTVTFFDRTPVALDSVSFDLHPGRVLAIVGDSGSGKSVTAMSVLGLLPPTATAEGSIRFGGRELLGARVADTRSLRGGQIGIVFQEPFTAFDPLFRVGEQIAEAIRAHTTRPNRRAVRTRVLELLMFVGLREPGIETAFPHQLSGGQLQRAMIAVAISNGPSLLIADEPTTALDSIAQAGILDLIRSLAKDRGMAVLLITHNMGVVADLADDAIVLSHGAIVEAGSANKVLLAPTRSHTRQLLAAVPALASAPVAPKKRSASTATVAELDQATVSYRDHGRAVTALNGVDLRIASGEVVGLVGESGAGKSTVGRALAGLVPLTAGSASISGTDVSRARNAARRSALARMGYVFQDPASSLNPNSTVGWSIAEPLSLHTNMSSQQRTARVVKLLNSVNMPSDFASRYPHELSGGERQRVAIARALALEPQLLIADEPTSALDVSTQAVVLDVLAELQRRLGFACLLISHDLALVQHFANTVVILRAGRVVTQGPTHTVLTGAVDPYVQQLMDAVPIIDPEAQAVRRMHGLELPRRG